MSLKHSPDGADPRESVTRAAWSISQWCDEAGIGRVKTYAEIKQGRVRAKKCGKRTLIITPPAEWLNSLPDMGGANAA